MRSRKLALLFVGSMLVAALSACGGGSGGGQDGGQENQGSGDAKSEKKQPKTETVEGRVARVDLEKNRVVTRPEEGEPMSLTLRPDGDAATEISLDGEDASPEDIEPGQQAEVEYRVVTNEEKDRERNVALSMQLTSAGGGGTGAQESTEN